jgi:hypothetical protein
MCVKFGKLCLLVRKDGPVAMPLPEEERSASVTPISGNSLRSLWQRPVMNERSLSGTFSERIGMG